MAIFMHFGEWGCVALCGAFYFSSTSLVAFLLLQREEWRLIQTQSITVFALLVTLSLIVFAMLAKISGAESIYWGSSFLMLWIVAGFAAFRFFPSGEKNQNLAEF